MENENILNQEKTSLVKDLQNNIFQEFNELLISDLKFENKNIFLMEKFLNGIDKILNNENDLDINNIALKYFTVSINLSKEYKNLKLYDEAFDILEKAEYKNFNIKKYSDNFFIYKSFVLKEKIELLNTKFFPNVNMFFELQKLLKLSQYCLTFIDVENERNIKNLLSYSYFNIINQCFNNRKYNELKAFSKDFYKIIENLNICFYGIDKVNEISVRSYNISVDILMYEIDETIFDRIEENLKEINLLLKDENFYNTYKEKLTSILVENHLFLVILNKTSDNNEFLPLADENLEMSLKFLKEDIDKNKLYLSTYLNAIFIILNFLESKNLNFEDYLKYVLDVFYSIDLENKLNKYFEQNLNSFALNIYFEIKEKLKKIKK